MHALHSRTPERLSAGVATLLWTALTAGAALLVLGPVDLPAGAPAIGLLTLFVAAVVASFSRRYMRADSRQGRYFAMLAALVGSVLAFLASGDLVSFALAWCASGWLLAGLIGHVREWPEARAAARRARLTFAFGDAALLAALAALGAHSGSLRLDAALAEAALMPWPLATATALLVALAATARCALPPFAGWLLSSMTAPTPVSALMHAGLVNAGGFLLIRFAPLMEAAPAARAAVVAAGLIAAVYGVGIAMVRPDVKRALAGSTVSQMGFMIMSCGLGAYAAALWHIVAHGLFKAWLFLGSGSAVGMKNRAPLPLSEGACIAIAAATLALGLGAFAAGQGEASLVPLLLGIATAAATLLAATGGSVPGKARAVLVLAIAAMIGLNALGLSLAHAAIGADGAPLVPAGALVALLATFLAAWLWQQRRLRAGRGLPLPLYVHFMNAGALPRTVLGDA